MIKAVRRLVRELFQARKIIHEMGKAEGVRLYHPINRYVESLAANDIPQTVKVNLGDVLRISDAYHPDFKPGLEWQHPAFFKGLVESCKGLSNSDVVQFTMVPQAYRNWPDDRCVPRKFLQVEMTIQRRTHEQIFSAELDKDLNRQRDKSVQPIRGGPKA